MWYSKLGKTFISRNILHQYWYTCPIALPVRRNTQDRRFYCFLSHFLTYVSSSATFEGSWENLSTQLWTTLRYKHLLRYTEKNSSWIYFALNPFAHKILTEELCSSVVQYQAWSPLWLLKQASEHAHVRRLSRLSCSWTVLLPSDTHRNPITSITTVLLPFVAYLLTLPRIRKSAECQYVKKLRIWL
jgi:hypothetical protein